MKLVTREHHNSILNKQILLKTVHCLHKPQKVTRQRKWLYCNGRATSWPWSRALFGTHVIQLDTDASLQSLYTHPCNSGLQPTDTNTSSDQDPFSASEPLEFLFSCLQGHRLWSFLQPLSRFTFSWMKSLLRGELKGTHRMVFKQHFQELSCLRDRVPMPHVQNHHYLWVVMSQFLSL